MLAEIGGYLGLLLGVSVVQVAGFFIGNKNISMCF